MTLEEALRQLAVPKKARKAIHPLAALAGTLTLTTPQLMEYLTNRGGIFSDLWERTPTPQEVTWGEVVSAFEAAKTRLNPVWCDAEISSIKSKILP